jgi:hypothetical protein
MVINEISCKINSLQKDHYIVQFISEDFALISGMLDINIKNVTKSFAKKYYCILSNNKIFNLIISKQQYEKVTYDSIKRAFSEMRTLLLNRDLMDIIDKNKIAVPEYGIGFENLDWNIIKDILSDLFFDTNLEITFVKNE